MATDVVCQMEVDERSAAGQTTYEGKPFYFCVPRCRETFEKDPGRYVPKETDSLGRQTVAGR